MSKTQHGSEQRRYLPPSLRHLERLPLQDLAQVARISSSRSRTISQAWTAQPRQAAVLKAAGLLDALDGGVVHRAACQILGYGGAAFGGKTDVALTLSLLVAVVASGSQVGYFRRTFAELEGADAPISRSMGLFKQFGGKYNQTKHAWFWNPEGIGEEEEAGTGSAVRFCHCQHENDVSMYLSDAFDVLIFDEATTFTWYIIDHLLARNRRSTYGTLEKPFCIMLSNPGDVGHSWFMQEFGIPSGRLYDTELEIKEKYEPKMVTNPNGKEEETLFIPAFAEDNQAGLQRDPDYLDKLLRRADGLGQAMRYGDWSVFSGQLFSEFMPSKNGEGWHVIDPFPIPNYWVKWRSYDWGYAAPFSQHWYAVDPQTRRVYVFDEVYMAGLLDSQQAQMMKDKSVGMHIQYTLADPSIWKTQTVGEEAKTTADVFMQNGIMLTAGDNRQENKIKKVHQALGVAPDGKPYLQVFRNCANLIRTLPALSSKPNQPDKLLDGQEDHCFDDLGYGLSFWTPPFSDRTPEYRNPQKQIVNSFVKYGRDL